MIHFSFQLAPNNKNLEPDSYYTLFIRAYVTDSLYESTGWYPVTLTSKDNDIGGSKGSTAAKQKGKCNHKMNYLHALYIKSVLRSLQFCKEVLVLQFFH